MHINNKLFTSIVTIFSLILLTISHIQTQTSIAPLFSSNRIPSNPLIINDHRERVSSVIQPACQKKMVGDSDCNGTIDLGDFNIWRTEFFATCTETNLSVCGPDADSDGSLMDANFNYTGSGNLPVETSALITIVDFNIWRTGYFAASITATPTSTPTPTIVRPTNTSTPTSTGPTATATPTPPTGACTYPAQKLDLTNWKITLPIGSGSPTEILQPQLATYSIDPWFMVLPNCAGVQFRAHTSSPVTTSNSSYPRSELREMKNNGRDQANWTNTSGIHTMQIDQAIMSVPTGKKHVVAGQIHDGSNDVIVIRLEYPKLFIDINGTEGPTLDAAYTLGTRFTVKFVAANQQIKVFYNGSTTPAHTLNKSISNSYFKAGAYTQSNCTREQEYNSTCSASNYGEVHIYDLQVTHQ